MASVLKVGVTGGIGSGKTTVCRIFSALGVPVFSADAEARRIMDGDDGIKPEIRKITGEDLYSSGLLDRSRMAELIFNDPGILKKVNMLVHPAVFKGYEAWLVLQDFPYAIIEAAILFESGGYRKVDRIISIIAPEEERLGRVMLRNNLTREQVLDRMRNQIADDDRIKLSDFVIDNSENSMIVPEVLRIHKVLLGLAV
ncbi:MAG: dephospho-CoA kinase [Bacteroidales bacterium]|nr:dephospho-CoA kinase [Bacteroidales bacterium]